MHRITSSWQLHVHRRLGSCVLSSGSGATPLHQSGAPQEHPRASHSASPLGSVSVQLSSLRTNVPAPELPVLALPVLAPQATRDSERTRHGARTLRA